MRYFNLKYLTAILLGLLLASNVAFAGIGGEAKPPMVFAYLNTTQSFTSGTFATVNFNAEVVDNYNFFNTGTATFSPLKPGYYQINWIIKLSSATASLTTARSEFLCPSGPGNAVSTWMTQPASTNLGVSGSALCYYNGSTSSTIRATATGTSPYFDGGSVPQTYFTAIWVSF